MKTTNKWAVRDVITTVLMSVLLIVIQLIVNMVCMMNDFVSMVLSVGFTMLMCGPVFFLMVGRVRKHGVTLLYMGLRRADSQSGRGRHRSAGGGSGRPQGRGEHVAHLRASPPLAEWHR